jgi:hypothetical protein
MKVIKQFFILFFSAMVTLNVYASSLKNAYKSLIEFDYFKAKKIFYSINKKQTNPFASFGLAVIYYRNDNPFYNLDSATKYINLSYTNFIFKQKPKQFLSFKIDSINILKMIDSIATKSFSEAQKINSVTAYHHFLEQNYLANRTLIKRAVVIRDELEFNTTLTLNKSTETQQFIITHPQSELIPEAVLLLEGQFYYEATKSQTEVEYISFLKNYPNSRMINLAYEKLFQIYKNQASLNGLTFYVNNYPKAPQNSEAWKLLFSRSVKTFNSTELQSFLNTHPNCPLKSTILNELELNNLQLFSFQKNDYFGFIDSLGTVVIPVVYDAITPFIEGLSVVTKKDSVFFINKKNQTIFQQYYSEAYPFNNGIAAVKQFNTWVFINRQAEVISDTFDEVNELSNDCYVIKKNNKYGALDRFAHTIIEAKFEKMGDFKNEFAYYVENGKYGLVSKNGFLFKANYDWISDMGYDNIAIFKQNNKYGLINTKDSIILQAQFDQIVRAENSIFILVQGSSYGFYSGLSQCYLSAIAFDYLKEKPTDFYTNGNLLKLLKNKQQAFADVNGKITIDFGAFNELNFASTNLIRVKRKNKYGFLNQKLNNVIPFKYSEAQDFTDSIAIVKFKDKISLLNLNGIEVYSSEHKIKKISKHLFLVDSPEKLLINNKGETVLSPIESIQKSEGNCLIITLTNNQLKLLYD